MDILFEAPKTYLKFVITFEMTNPIDQNDKTWTRTIWAVSYDAAKEYATVEAMHDARVVSIEGAF